MQKNILVTGGAGFIGSALVRYLINETEHCVLNVDKLTYAGNLESLGTIEDNPRYTFAQADIADASKIAQLFADFQPDYVMHLAAESHVDRSIDGPIEFIQTNVVGTSVLLESARGYWLGLENDKKQGFRFHHISTDEVFGDLSPRAPAFTEQNPYEPSSPYAASKASSDHLVRAWHRTYGLPVVVSNCSNNYGPYHFPEKLIPLVILNALEGKKLPVYGDGQQIRDWLYVEDHVRALYRVVTQGQIGETYNIGGHNEKANIEVVRMICSMLDKYIHDKPSGITQFDELIEFVADRPGHDQRYAIDAAKIGEDLGWYPEESFETGIAKTVQWYLENRVWCERVQDGSYRRERLGSGELQ